MKYSWALDLYDNEGDAYEECVLAFIGENTIIKFKDSFELEAFAQNIMASLKNIREKE